MAVSGEIQASDVSTLRDAAAVRAYSGGRFMTRLGRLEIAGARPDVLARWQEPLDRSAQACGCREGSAAVLAALVALVLCAVAGVSVDWVVDEPISWIATLFAAALLGKLAGLAWAALRLRRLASVIERWEAAR